MQSVRQRLKNAIDRTSTDRLPVTTHHIMDSFMNNFYPGKTKMDFFRDFGLDAIVWPMAYQCDEAKGEFFDPEHTQLGFLEARRVCADNWRYKIEDLFGYEYTTRRYSIITPDKTLSMILQGNEHTTWILEHLIKDKNDIDILAKYMPAPKCDVSYINSVSMEVGTNALVRGHICSFDGFGQPGCWQDAACLFGIEQLIMETYDDPEWVHALLAILKERKQVYIRSLSGAEYDLLELGGGDASTTVISPEIFDEFVAPYDAVLIEEAHKVNQKIVYHTCGGMMPILENIAAMKPDAMETFTPPGMGGDVSLKEAKRRIGDKVCMIGGFDQFHFFTGCTPEETRREVRRCFEEAGEGGGFILSPSDHFFEADLSLIRAFVEEAKICI